MKHLKPVNSKIEARQKQLINAQIDHINSLMDKMSTAPDIKTRDALIYHLTLTQMMIKHVKQEKTPGERSQQIVSNIAELCATHNTTQEIMLASHVQRITKAVEADPKNIQPIMNTLNIFALHQALAPTASTEHLGHLKASAESILTPEVVMTQIFNAFHKDDILLQSAIAYNENYDARALAAAISDGIRKHAELYADRLTNIQVVSTNNNIIIKVTIDQTEFCVMRTPALESPEFAKTQSCIESALASPCASYMNSAFLTKETKVILSERYSETFECSVMPWATGTLGMFCQEATFLEMMNAIIKTTEMVHALKEAGFIYPDIKPGNILYNTDERDISLVLTDLKSLVQIIENQLFNMNAVIRNTTDAYLPSPEEQQLYHGMVDFATANRQVNNLLSFSLGRTIQQMVLQLNNTDFSAKLADGSLDLAVQQKLASTLAGQQLAAIIAELTHAEPAQRLTIDTALLQRLQNIQQAMAVETPAQPTVAAPSAQKAARPLMPLFGSMQNLVQASPRPPQAMRNLDSPASISRTPESRRQSPAGRGTPPHPLNRQARVPSDLSRHGDGDSLALTGSSSAESSPVNTPTGLRKEASAGIPLRGTPPLKRQQDMIFADTSKTSSAPSADATGKYPGTFFAPRTSPVPRHNTDLAVAPLQQDTAKDKTSLSPAPTNS